MAPPISSLSSFLLICLLTSPSISLDSSSTCFPQSPAFLPLQCPLPFSPSSPFQMDGDSLEKILNTIPTNVYIAVLFYASWCPFSTGLKTKFDILSSMFPKIGHIAVEQSSVMPSVFSQYGVHSLPAVLLVNQREKMRYYGPKDLHSLAQFYRRTTGLDPVEDVMNDDVEKLMEQEVIQPWYRASWKEIVVKEPYLTGAIAFLVLRAVLYFSPEILTHIMAVWVSCKRYLNVGVWGEASQVVGRVLQMMDVKRGWNKLKLCKPRNLHKRAGSARAWASSLASVSLGEASSARRPSSISTDS